MAGALGVEAVAAVDAHCLFAEPAEELAAVDDLATSLGERLAHLEGHQQREVLLVLLHEVERATEDVAARAGCGRRPGVLRGDGRIERADAVAGRRIGDRADDRAGGRVLHVEGLAGFAIRPLVRR